VPEIVTNRFRLIDKELALCLEIAELENHVDRRRISMHGIKGVVFGWAQIEIDAPLFVGETRQAVQIIDLAGGKNWQAT
jgi:hypothetical protein